MDNPEKLAEYVRRYGFLSIYTANMDENDPLVVAYEQGCAEARKALREMSLMLEEKTKTSAAAG